jgi:hypothetical protein
VKIGAADARVTGRNQHLVRPDAWIGRIAEADVSIVVQDASFHSLLLSPLAVWTRQRLD